MPPLSSLARAARTRTARTAAVAMAAAAIGAGAVIAVDGGADEPVTSTAAAAATAAPSTSVSLTAGQTDFSDIYASRSAGIVSILAASGGGQGDSASPFSPESPQGGGGTAQGSGVVIDADGHILTNEHVVSGATTLRVTLASGTTLDAEIVGTDPSTDLALIKVDVPDEGLTVVPIGSSSDLEVGEPVLAIGNPFGYMGSATAGIVSGLGRSITSPNGFSVPDAIQTDAAVNHGNSGGALLNAAGELVGVPTQIADSGVDANVGVAFAVPSDTAARVIESLRSDGSVDHAWLGVSTATVGQELSGVEGIGADSGALITGVAQGGPAQRAGLSYGDTLAQSIAGPVCTGGDVVTELDGDAVTSASDLQEAVDAKAPGSTVTLTVVNASGERRSVEVQLSSRPESAPQTATGCDG